MRPVFGSQARNPYPLAVVMDSGFALRASRNDERLFRETPVAYFFVLPGSLTSLKVSNSTL
jgi:hypothetical protein